MTAKRLLALLLALSALTLCACGGGGSLAGTGTETAGASTAAVTTAETGGVHDPTGFCVGFGRAAITPISSVPLAGYGNTTSRMSTRVLDDLFCSCVAVRDEGGETLLLYSFDLINISSSLGKSLRTLITGIAKVPEDNILLNATHTHSGPDLNVSSEAINSYRNEVIRGASNATKAALADLDACTAMETGAAETDRLNFTRRYYASNGVFVTDNFNADTAETILSHEFRADEEMRAVRFVRTNQPDVVLANWQCHPHRTGGAGVTDISADIIGAMRDKAEKDLGVKFLYLQGGAGNVNPTSRIQGEARLSAYKEIGAALAETLSQALQGAKDLGTGPVRAKTVRLSARINHEKDALAEQCEAIVKMRAQDSGKAAAMAKDLGLGNVLEAAAIVNRAALTKDVYDFPVAAYAIGDLGIAAAPFEMFSNTYQDLRAASPFAFTLTCGYSNSSEGYMPAASSFDNGGYEVYVCYYVRGTAEEITATQLSLLNELKAR
ncbi:MAG: hypothetical protein II776_08045 [Clostridia bacterium]|nr:hypothetical protein [Clostridia bacterium]